MNFWNRHIGDIIRDTVSLTMLEDGAYNRLLDQYYQTERPLPLDKKMIYRLARATSTAERKACDFVIDTFFKAEQDGYHQKRCDLEIAAYADKQRKAQASANARWNKSEGNANASETHDASDMRTHSEGNAHQTPIANNQKPERQKTTPRVTALSSSDLVADGVTEQTANEFLDLRRKKRAPLTPGAWDGIKTEATKAGWSMQAAVAKCVARGWQGFEAEWVSNVKAPNGHRMTEGDRRIAEFLGETREAYPDDGMTIDMESIR